MTDAAIADANELVRAAVEMRRERQAAGKPHEEWYDVSMPVTEPMPEVAKAEEMQHVNRGISAAEVLERFAPDAETLKAARDFVAAREEFKQWKAPEQPTTSQRFLDLLDEMRRLHESKSADYGSETDPLANIRQGAEFVGIEPWRGCMVRIADKVQRLKTYCRTGRLVHEGVRDTLLDLSAYSLLAIVLFDEGNDS
jgi:hypothetical protein